MNGVLRSLLMANIDMGGGLLRHRAGASMYETDPVKGDSKFRYFEFDKPDVTVGTHTITIGLQM